MAALDRAVALAERDDVPVRVREQLHLDVPRPLEVALEVEGAVAERGLRLPLGGLLRLLELLRAADDAHAASAATCRRLDDEREADLVRATRSGAPARPPPARPASPPPCRRRAAARSAGGPTHVRPAASTASAKSAFSARNPYPGGSRRRPPPSRRERAPPGRGSSRSRPSRPRTARGASRASSGATTATVRDAELAARPEDPNRDLAAVRDQQLRDRHVATLGAAVRGRSYSARHDDPPDRQDLRSPSSATPSASSSPRLSSTT